MEEKRVGEVKGKGGKGEKEKGGKKKYRRSNRDLRGSSCPPHQTQRGPEKEKGGGGEGGRGEEEKKMEKEKEKEEEK